MDDQNNAYNPAGSPPGPNNQPSPSPADQSDTFQLPPVPAAPYQNDSPAAPVSPPAPPQPSPPSPPQSTPPSLDTLAATPQPAPQPPTRPSNSNPVFPIQNSQPQPEDRSSGVLSSLFAGLWALVAGVLNWVVIPLGIVLVLHNFVFQAFHVVGSSMVPSLHETDYLVISKVEGSVARAKSLSDKNAYVPERGEIVVFRYPKDPSLVFVKRVIGLPGERVVVKGGKITVYNEASPQGFNPDTTSTYKVADSITLGDYDDTIPEGNVFVVGDNRAPNGSFDSREWGPLPTNHIIGEAAIRLLPIDDFRIF